MTRTRSRPTFKRTTTDANGTTTVEIQTLEEVSGTLGNAGEVLLEHNVLHNNVLSKESDRAVAVLAPAYLDAILEELLGTILIPGKSAKNLLSSDRAPLGTFSARIDAAHALGLIKDDAWHDLHLVRGIRNDFAHAVDAHSFAYEPVLNRCREFQLKKRWREVPPCANGQEARLRFLFVIWALVGDISQAISNAKGPRGEA